MIKTLPQAGKMKYVVFLVKYSCHMQVSPAWMRHWGKKFGDGRVSAMIPTL